MAVTTKDEFKLLERGVKALERIAKQMETLNGSVFQVEVMAGGDDEEDEGEEEEVPLTGKVVEVTATPAD